MIIKACVGSSCHLKGSYDVIEALKALVKKYGVEDLVQLQASFCLAHCEKGVSVTVSLTPDDLDGLRALGPDPENITYTDDSAIFHRVSGENLDTLFPTYILPFVHP